MGLVGGQLMAVANDAEAQPSAPRVLIPAKGYAPVILPDGTLEHYFVQGQEGRQVLVCVRSHDQGETWSELETVLALPVAQKWAGRGPQPMVDSRGGLHLFMLEVGPKGQFSWHTMRAAAAREWTTLNRIGKGGLQVPAIQLKTGRMVAAVSYNVARSRWDEMLGGRASTSYYSDDYGQTWKPSPTELRIAGFDDQTVRNGASLPAIVELKDGRVWMLLRTQTGWLYEAFSEDAISWSEPRPSQFRSSDSPACLVRLPGGELVVLWNNISSPSPVDGAWMYPGRDALHGAISSDEGATWSGFREIYLDPRRDLPPHKNTDRGAASPNAVATPDGKIIMAVCERDERVMLSFDPGWLKAVGRRDDFSNGLAGWSTFRAIGPVDAYWRNRVAGAGLVSHPDRAGARCLALRNATGAGGDGATWNFPTAKTGRLSVRLKLDPDFQGAAIALSDRFYFPQEIDAAKATFTLPIKASGHLADGVSLQNGRWHELTFEWRMEESTPRGGWPGKCVVSVDGVNAITLPQLNRARSGVNYLRVNTTSDGRGGLLIEEVSSQKL